MVTCGFFFINRQILPVDRDNLSESIEMVPNYGLHLIGGPRSVTEVLG